MKMNQQQPPQRSTTVSSTPSSSEVGSSASAAIVAKALHQSISKAAAAATTVQDNNMQRTISRRRSSGGSHHGGGVTFSEDGSLSSDGGMHLLDGGSGSFGMGGGMGGEERDEEKEVAKLARWETNNLRGWRTGVFLLLLILGATISTVAFVFFQQAEQQDFKVDYYNFANTIRDISQNRIKNTITAFNELSVTITAYALQESSSSSDITIASSNNNNNVSSSSSFPYVTMPMFEVSAQQARLKSGVPLLAYCPIVSQSQQESWANYTYQHQDWIASSREIHASSDFFAPPQQPSDGDDTTTTYWNNASITPHIWQYDTITQNPIWSMDPPYAPTWQVSPPPYSPEVINYNFFSEDYIKELFHTVLVARESVMSAVQSSASTDGSGTINTNVLLENHLKHEQPAPTAPTANDQNLMHPHSILAQPIFNRLKDESSSVSALLLAVIPWDRYVVGLLPEHVKGIYVVLRNSCNQSYTYKLDGSAAIYLGPGVLHIEDKWKHMEVTFSLSDHLHNETKYEEGHCTYTFSVYPSSEMSASWRTPLAFVFAIASAVVFGVTAILFSVYDRKVDVQNKTIIAIAARSNKLVSSLFPSTVRDRLLAGHHDETENGLLGDSLHQHHQLIGMGGGGMGGGAGDGVDMQGTKTRIKDFLANDGPISMEMEQTNDFMYKTKPIADLFPETTILFADIAGFTAWSSAREPSQVFTLLETVYRAFDIIAKRRRIFKVETVGDCYVAVAGLPEPRKDHAVAMARFARGCMRRMHTLTRRLEVTLGPDTADLTMRMGLHSGPVTAGVLRGDNARFQLFGDTMNTASRMESTGQRDRIQLSTETANLLINAGKSDWIVPREEKIVAKGKGEMSTFWLILEGRDGQSVVSGGEGSVADDDNSHAEKNAMLNVTPANGENFLGDLGCSAFTPKIQRMIDWNVDLLTRLLHGIVARRRVRAQLQSTSDEMDERREKELLANEMFHRADGTTVLDEVQDYIALPDFDKTTARTEVDPDSIELDPIVGYQLHDYVSAIAAMYRENNFHNFEHASHVTMSVAKLLSRIVAPSDLDFENKATKHEALHDHTYGITSDPLTQFACILSALVHDVDHTGVPNTRLVEENKILADVYRGRSVAEQNSVDLAWNLLMEENFTELRRTIYETSDELNRFRHLVVNCVMSTDIMDKDLKAARNGRWQKAFSEQAALNDEDARATTNRKATIVIEHLMQASDVSHTMQHWHIFRKWNERLFREMYSAYLQGRAEKNPADFWYDGEIGFFDFYVIPLAKKLKECGVFGVSSAEYLQYAMKNRKEWEARGREVVGELVEAAQRNHDDMQTETGVGGLMDKSSRHSILKR